MEPKRINICDIKNPQFLKDFNYKELSFLASDIRNEIISATAKNGGHVSSNLGVVELVMMLHRSFDFSNDKLLLDVGHQCYTHKILTGRSLETLRQKDGVSGFQKRYESKYDCFEAGHSSTSISTAHGMAVARDISGKTHEVVALIGDGSLASGLAFEGLNNVSHTKSKVIIVLNDNDMSISKSTGGTARFLQKIRSSISYNRTRRAYQKLMCKTRFGNWIYDITSAMKNKIKGIFLSNNVFDLLGYVYLGPIDGHNLKALNKAMKRAKKSVKSVVIHVHTIKGKGYSFAEKDRTGYWHGVSPFNQETGYPLTKNNEKISWSEVYANLLEKVMKEDSKTVLINPAMINGSSLEKVFATYPERCFDVGICEEHAVTMASGIALSGLKPIVSVYSTFLQRAYDELNQDLARMKLNATLLIDRAGLVGADGETHQGIFDESMLYTIPNTIITMASNKAIAEQLLNESVANSHGLFAIRLPRDYIDNNDENNVSLSFGEWLPVIEGFEKVVVTFGPMIQNVSDALKKLGLGYDLINAIYQKPILENNVLNLLKYKKIVIYNPYATEMGFAQNLKSLLLKYNYIGEVISLTLPDEFIKHATIDQQLKLYHVDIDSLMKMLS